MINKFQGEGFGDYFRRLRRSKGFKSQKELAGISKISQTTISRIEDNTQKPTKETLITLAATLDVSENELLYYAGYTDSLSELEQAKIDFQDYDYELDSEIKKLLRPLVDTTDFYEFVKPSIVPLFNEKVDICSPSEIMEFIYRSKDWDWKLKIIEELKLINIEFIQEIEQYEFEEEKKKKRLNQRKKLLLEHEFELIEIVDLPNTTYKGNQLNDEDRKQIKGMLKVLLENKPPHDS